MSNKWKKNSLGFQILLGKKIVILECWCFSLMFKFCIENYRF